MDQRTKDRVPPILGILWGAFQLVVSLMHSPRISAYLTFLVIYACVGYLFVIYDTHRWFISRFKRPATLVIYVVLILVAIVIPYVAVPTEPTSQDHIFFYEKWGNHWVNAQGKYASEERMRLYRRAKPLVHSFSSVKVCLLSPVVLNVYPSQELSRIRGYITFPDGTWVDESNLHYWHLSGSNPITYVSDIFPGPIASGDGAMLFEDIRFKPPLGPHKIFFTIKGRVNDKPFKPVDDWFRVLITE